MLDSIASLPATVARLLHERTSHIEKLTQIDATLARVNAALGGVVATAAAVSAKPVATTKPTQPKRSGPTANGQTANEFVLSFVKSKANPTSAEINAAWKAAGRNRTADINLSQLTKAGRLKRTPLGEGRQGSRYSMIA